MVREEPCAALGNWPTKRLKAAAVEPVDRDPFELKFALAEHPSQPLEHALRFLRGSRALSGALSRNDKLQKMLADRFGETFRTVGDYFTAYASAVKIEDVSPWLSELAEKLIAEPDTDANELGEARPASVARQSRHQ